MYEFPLFLSAKAIIRKFNSGHCTPCLSRKRTSVNPLYFLWAKLRVHGFLSLSAATSVCKTFTEAFYMGIYAPNIAVLLKPL